MTEKQLVQELSEIADLQDEIKDCSMIYQYSAKCHVAKHFGLTFEQVNLPFHQWMELRAKYKQETGFDL